MYGGQNACCTIYEKRKYKNCSCVDESNYSHLLKNTGTYYLAFINLDMTVTDRDVEWGN